MEKEQIVEAIQRRIIELKASLDRRYSQEIELRLFECERLAVLIQSDFQSNEFLCDISKEIERCYNYYADGYVFDWIGFGKHLAEWGKVRAIEKTKAWIKETFTGFMPEGLAQKISEEYAEKMKDKSI